MCNNVIINRLKALKKKTYANGTFVRIDGIQEIIDEFEQEQNSDNIKLTLSKKQSER